MKKFIYSLVLIFCLLPLFAISQPGSWKLIGKAGEWKNTITCVGLADKFYTIENSGALYSSDIAGNWTQIGKEDFINTKYFAAAGQKLYTIEKDGSLFEINSANGSWKLLGTKGEYINTIACVGLNGKIYSIDNAGALYVTYNDGSWEQIGKNDFVNTRRIIAVGKNLVSLEKDGSLYLINVE